MGEVLIALTTARLPDSSLLVLTVPDRYRQARGGSAASAVDGPAFVREGDFWRASFGICYG